MEHNRTGAAAAHDTWTDSRSRAIFRAMIREAKRTGRPISEAEFVQIVREIEPNRTVSRPAFEMLSL